MRLYSELAEWWPLLSPPSHYVEEAEYVLGRLPKAGEARPALLELGAGGGSLAHHLRDRFHLTLTDLSPEMLAVSAAVNPDVEHLVGDMRSLRLGKLFDVVLIHDAISYMTTPADLQAALATAAAHCRIGGSLLVQPDHVAETFATEHSTGGEDGADGRALRYLLWSYDPDPDDTHFDAIFALLLRSANGQVRVETDHHREGLFRIDQWLEWLTAAGFDANVEVDPWDRHVFLGTRVDPVRQ